MRQLPPSLCKPSLLGERPPPMPKHQRAGSGGAKSTNTKRRFHRAAAAGGETAGEGEVCAEQRAARRAFSKASQRTGWRARTLGRGTVTAETQNMLAIAPIIIYDAGGNLCDICYEVHTAKACVKRASASPARAFNTVANFVKVFHETHEHLLKRPGACSPLGAIFGHDSRRRRRRAREQLDLASNANGDGEASKDEVDGEQ
jgi:hypothetical protein